MTAARGCVRVVVREQVALQVETCDWGGDTEEELRELVSGFVADILASSGRAGKEASSAAADVTPHDTEDQRKMRLRAMSSCLSPFRALYLHGCVFMNVRA